MSGKTVSDKQKTQKSTAKETAKSPTKSSGKVAPKGVPKSSSEVAPKGATKSTAEVAPKGSSKSAASNKSDSRTTSAATAVKQPIKSKQSRDDQKPGGSNNLTVLSDSTKATESIDVREDRAITIGPLKLPGQAPRQKVGGVAPYITPRKRPSGRTKLNEINRRGFVPLSPGKQKLRHRILPRTVIGISTMLMCAGIGAAFSGAAFYAYYDNRLADNEQTVARFVEGFDQQFTDAAGAIDDLRVGAISEIRSELDPLKDQITDAEGVTQLPVTIGESVWMLETRNEDGQIANGSAFAIVGHQGGTAFVTSHSLVIASTTAPSPGIDLVKGNRRVPAQLWAWDPERDLALVVVDEVVPPLKFATDSAQVSAVGGRVFAMSGVGGQGATASPGVLLDHSLAGLQHTTPVGALFVGGPLVTGEGLVVGVAADNYQPYGFDAGPVPQAPDIRSICAVVIECSEIREEVVLEVSADETVAPPRSDTELRPDLESEEELEGEDGEVIEDDAFLPGDADTIDPTEEPAPSGSTTDNSDSDDSESGD